MRMYTVFGEYISFGKAAESSTPSAGSNTCIPGIARITEISSIAMCDETLNYAEMPGSAPTSRDLRPVNRKFIVI